MKVHCKNESRATQVGLKFGVTFYGHWVKRWQVFCVLKNVFVINNWDVGIILVQPVRYLAISNNENVSHPRTVLLNASYGIDELIEILS